MLITEEMLSDDKADPSFGDDPEGELGGRLQAADQQNMNKIDQSDGCWHHRG